MYFHYAVDGIIGFEYKDKEYTYKKNIQGDIIGIYNPENKLICKYIYDAWGNHDIYILNESNGISSYKTVDNSNNTEYTDICNLNPFRYRGYYYDTETDLYYLNSRYYDPELGRFINADAIDNIDTENLNGFNLYMYCADNPVMLIDNSGEGWNNFWNKVGNWFKDHAKELIIGTVFIIAGAIVTAATAGTGVGFMAAFGSALLSSAIQVGTSIAVGVVVNGFVNLVNGQNFFANVGDTIANSYMWGGIFSGGSQILSGGFRVASKMGVTTGRRGGISLGRNIKILSPDKNNWFGAGGTIIKFGNTLRIDVGIQWGLHIHLLKFNHFPIGSWLAGILGALTKY